MSTSVEELSVGSCERLVSAVRDIFEPDNRIVTIFPQWSLVVYVLFCFVLVVVWGLFFFFLLFVCLRGFFW